MFRPIFRRTLSALLAVTLLLTTMVVALPFTASAGVDASEATDTSDVIFLVPEAIYLQPTWNSYYQSQQMPFQIYINNTLDDNQRVVCSAQEETQGKIFFYYAQTGSAKISFEWRTASGDELRDGSIQFGDGIVRAAGKAYTATSSASQSIAIYSGTSPTIDAAQTGVYLKWTATFTDNTDGREKTAVAYTYVYKPYVAPVGTVIRVKNTHGTNTYGSNIAWVCGVHGITGAQGSYYANTTLSSSGKGLLPLSSSVPNGEQVGTEGLYAQFANADANQSRFFHDGITDGEPEPSLWINQTTSPRYLPDATLNYVDNNTGTSWFGDYSYFSLVYSPTAVLTVDTSRYINLSQIPNLSVAMLVTDTRNTVDGGAWFFSNYTGTPADEYYAGNDSFNGTAYYNNEHNGTTTAEGLWNRYSASDVFVATEGSYANPESGAQAQGTKYNGRWKKPISTSSTSGMYYIGAGYFNRDSTDSGDHYGNDTIWNVSEIRTNISFYNKALLRTAVQNAIGKSPILNSAFYDITSVYWENYESLYQAASMALTKVDGAFSASAVVDGVNQTYTSPDQLANELTNAVNLLLQGSGRANCKAVQVNVGICLQENGRYKCISLGGETSREEAAFQTFDRVVFTANTYTGFTFMGLSKSSYEPAYQVGAEVTLPTSFTVSATGAVIDGSTVTYAHTDNVGTGTGAGTGTDTHGNLYYVYYYLVNTYTVSFHANGGTGTMESQAFQYSVPQNLTANAFSRRAYEFDGWATSPNGSKLYGDEQSVSGLVQEDGGVLDLYAVWKTVTYTIQYYLQGGSFVNQEHTVNYTVETPIGLPNAIKPGYELSGWRANGAGNWGEMTYGVGASIPLGKYGNVVLTAQWSPITYTIVFNGNGGEASGQVPTQTLAYEETRQLIANSFQRTGYSFAGWALDANATAAIFKDKAFVTNLTTVANDTVTLYAVWTASGYSVVYNTNGGTIWDETYSSQYTIADDLYLPVQVEKAGYGFAGWKPASSVGKWDEGKTYNGLLTAGMYGNVTLNAQWSLQTYTIRFEVDGSAVSSDTYTIHSSVTLPTAQKEGYLLSGWVPNGAGNWGETLYAVGTVGAGKYGDVTMTAQWKGVTYLIAFNGNGSTDGVMYNLSAEYGKDVTLTANAYVRNGYSFLGWAKSNTATRADYADGAAVRDLCSTQGDTYTLYAVWEKGVYSVTYDPLGGTIIEDSTAPYTVSYTVTDLLQLAAVERTGYTFRGWTPAFSVGSWQALVLYSGTLDAGKFGDVTLVAQWSRNTYAIRYDAAGGTMSGNYTTEYSVETVITLPDVTRAGFSFAGWQADAAWGGDLITDSTVPAGRTGNVMLRAVWTQRSYTIHFNACGGSGTMNDQVMQFDIAQPLTLNAFNRIGYTFGGWAVEEGGEGIYADGAYVTNLGLVENDTVELYAVWNAIGFTIKYDLNGAGGSMLNSNVSMNETVTLRGTIKTEATINNIPFLFAGWAFTPEEAAAGSVAYENKADFTMTEEVLAKDTVNWTGSKPTLTLYAVWVNVTVTLNGENGAIVDDENHLIYGVNSQINERILREEYLSITGYGTIEIENVVHVGTGTEIYLRNASGKPVATYRLVIFGDLDEDGVITQQDIAIIKAIMNGAQEEPEDSIIRLAGDLDGDGVLTMMDIMIIKGIINGSIEYDQATKQY